MSALDSHHVKVVQFFTFADLFLSLIHTYLKSLSVKFMLDRVSFSVRLSVAIISKSLLTNQSSIHEEIKCRFKAAN